MFFNKTNLPFTALKIRGAGNKYNLSNMENETKSNGVNKIITYIKASIEEMKKVTWPTKKETYNYTLLVIFISIGVALFLGLLDIIFTKGLEYLIINK